MSVGKSLLKGFDWLCDTTTIFILWGTVVVVMVQVLSRYIFKSPVMWTEEVARFAFIWLVFLGVAITERQNAHFRVTFLVEKAPPRLRYALWGVVELGIFLTLGLLFLDALKFTQMGARNISAVLQLRLDYIYVGLPVFVVLAIMNRLRNVVRTLRSGVENPFA